MPIITFQNNKYMFDNGIFNLQYFDSGDLHGNDNFRTQVKTLSVYDVLQQIDVTLWQSALAVVLDGKLMPLTTKLEKDYILDIITLNNPTGKIIYHHSLAYLIAQTIYTYNNNIQLISLSVSETKCILQFKFDFNNNLIVSVIKNMLPQIAVNNAAIQIIDAFQKEMLVNTYSSLSQPYAKTILDEYDDHDFITVAVRNHFALPIPKGAMIATNPKLITNYTLEHVITENICTITGQLTNTLI
ncbi:MAG: hypothetical protein IJE67_07555 [Peptococcaceae bacterium]|nr:hypothetical protein [Peptococcaceae bacterium]